MAVLLVSARAGTTLQSSEAGVMERIELVDFMCHRKLDVPLSPNVNFILGRNGSELWVAGYMCHW